MLLRLGRADSVPAGRGGAGRAAPLDESAVWAAVLDGLPAGLQVRESQFVADVDAGTGRRRHADPDRPGRVVVVRVRVLRVQLQVVDYQLISLPVLYEYVARRDRPILHVAPCRSGVDRIDAWFEEPDEVTRRRDVGIYIVGTGNPMPRALREYRIHLGTCVMASHLVWHVFEGPVQPS